jgi:hypothetical protein
MVITTIEHQMIMNHSRVLTSHMIFDMTEQKPEVEMAYIALLLEIRFQVQNRVYDVIYTLKENRL